MTEEVGRGTRVVFRVLLPVYLLYLAGCAWLYAYGSAAPDRHWRDVIHFLAEIAAGLPWTIAVLALPGVFTDFERYAGESFMLMVHVLVTLALLCNLLVINHLCEWRRLLPGEARAAPGPMR